MCPSAWGLSMINKVTIDDIKSFKKYTGPDEDFGEANIFYGQNGAGKSSLARGLHEQYSKGGGDPAAIRSFGRQYIEKSLLLDDGSGKIKGVKVNFGEKDVKLEAKIKDAENKLEDLKPLEEQNEKALKQAEKDIDTELKSILKRLKGNANIQNKPQNKTIEEQVDLWAADHTTAAKEFPDQDFTTITGNDDFEGELSAVNAISLPDITFTLDPSDDIQGILTKLYAKVDVPEKNIVEWIERGTHLHEKSEVCAFCGNSIDIAEVKKQLEVYLGDERHKAESTLTKFKLELDALCRKLELDIVKNSGLINNLIGETGDSLSAIAADIALLDNYVTDTIDAKISSMEKAITQTENVAEILARLSENYSKLTERKKEKQAEITGKINKKGSLTRGAIGYEVKNSQLIEEKLTALAAAKKTQTEITDERKSLTREIEELNSQKSDYSDFAGFINDVLKDIGMDFRLKLEEDSYFLVHVDETPVNIEDISEGERNFLVLVYFYYEMLDTDKTNLRSTIKTIIIDDPMTSMDDSNKFYITELMKNVIGNTNVQSFVLTHSWVDFCNISFGQNKERIKRFEINKEKGKSSLHLLTAKAIRPYKTLYKEVYEFSQLPLADITDDQVAHMPNVMRRVLEEWLRFNYEVYPATQNNHEEIACALFDKVYPDIKEDKRTKLNQMLGVCNILSHTIGDTYDRSEVHASAKFLMNRLSQVDTRHHNKMKV